VTTEPRSPAEHYQAAERLLAAAESSVAVAAEQIQQPRRSLRSPMRCSARPPDAPVEHRSRQHGSVLARSRAGCSATTRTARTTDKRLPSQVHRAGAGYALRRPFSAQDSAEDFARDPRGNRYRHRVGDEMPASSSACMSVRS
jgi:hypothetical protein